MNNRVQLVSQSARFVVEGEVNAGVQLAQPAVSTAKDIFVFLEVFGCEGGIQSYVKDILKSYVALAERSVQRSGRPIHKAEVFLLRDDSSCPNPFSQSDILKFHYFKSKSPALGRTKLALHLLLSLLKQRPRQVFCGHLNLAPLIRILCQPLGIPYTVLTYGKEFWTSLPDRDRQILQHASSIWTISRYSRDRSCTTNGLNPQRIQILPCAINGDYFTPGPKNPDLITKYGLGQSQVLMTVARLWSGDIYKGVDVTIRALPKIAQAFPEVKYLVIGRGDDQPRLAQLAQELGVADRVVFAGFVPTEQLVEHYRLADAYIMPSREGFGIVYLEAMACGVPVLSGDADGSADPLQDGRLGWRVPYRDAEAVAEACIDILQGITTDSDTNCDRRCDGQWLRQESLASFGSEAFVQRLEHLLKSLEASSKTP